MDDEASRRDKANGEMEVHSWCGTRVCDGPESVCGMLP